MVVQALEVVYSSFVNGEQAGSETEGCQKSSLTIQPEITAGIGSVRELSARENTIGDNLQAQAIFSQRPLRGQRNNP